ncbi:hypothetical protein ACU4GD_14360 [Cupriavidus basilensis]
MTAADRLSDGELRIPRSVLATPGFINLYVYQALMPKTCSCGLRHTAMKDALGARKLRQLSASSVSISKASGCRNPQSASFASVPICRAQMAPAARTVVAGMFRARRAGPRPISATPENIELAGYQRSKRQVGFDVPDSTGKTVFEVAMYKVFAGVVDPREAERLCSLDAYEARLARQRARGEKH